MAIDAFNVIVGPYSNGFTQNTSYASVACFEAVNVAPANISNKSGGRAEATTKAPGWVVVGTTNRTKSRRLRPPRIPAIFLNLEFRISNHAWYFELNFSHVHGRIR